MQPLPPKRTTDYEEAPVTVTSSSGFILRKVFYSVPSRLIGHRLRARLYDDRLDLYLGATHLMTLPRGRTRADGKADPVIDYRHVIHSLRAKPMALMDYVYRDKLFPRPAYARAFAALVAARPPRTACKTIVEILTIAHERACEAELADILTVELDAGQLPDLAELRRRFAPDPAALPDITVVQTSLSAYENLAMTGAAA